jgi:hypothetical protein
MRSRGENWSTRSQRTMALGDGDDDDDDYEDARKSCFHLKAFAASVNEKREKESWGISRIANLFIV